ncbi:hypothetical protein C4556_03845 [Candidatus Parcubacteria bacterium]|nr:MAG: hypothetical protein C4556_03845 [Candidatus Parcubacteria bacterium]
MEHPFFSKNGEILPVEQAAIPLSNIEYQYGFGVYETVRVTNSIPNFLKDHLERLAESARIIGLEHSFSSTIIYDSAEKLIEKNEVEACNLKILLIGGQTKDSATLYILCLNPLFPDKKLFRDGVDCITYAYERLFPHAKTLNMLGSYLGLREARRVNAYEALLLNRDGRITEGTRTNFFAMSGKTLYSAPEAVILQGVTRKAVLRVALDIGFVLEEKELRPDEVQEYGAFLTSTSSKILPIRSIDSLVLPEPSQKLRELSRAFDEFLEQNRGRSND